MKTYGNSPMENVIEFMTNISDAIFTGPPELVAKMKIGDNVEWNENGRVTRFVVTGISGCTVTMELVLMPGRCLIADKATFGEVINDDFDDTCRVDGHHYIRFKPFT